MRVLIACEFSGVVRDAFNRAGHDAYSCDLLPTEHGGPHLLGDALAYAWDSTRRWDLMIAHPPCTFLANSGNKHLYIGKRIENGRDPERWRLMREGVEFFRALWNVPIRHIAIENPIMGKHAKALLGVRQTQTVQPFQFGHAEQKATCLWIRNLPQLVTTNLVPPPYEQRVHREAPGPDRWKNRSRTYQGIADAMADQWGAFVASADRVAA